MLRPFTTLTWHGVRHLLERREPGARSVGSPRGIASPGPGLFSATHLMLVLCIPSLLRCYENRSVPRCALGCGCGVTANGPHGLPGNTLHRTQGNEEEDQSSGHASHMANRSSPAVRALTSHAASHAAPGYYTRPPLRFAARADETCAGRQKAGGGMFLGCHSACTIAGCFKVRQAWERGSVGLAGGCMGVLCASGSVRRCDACHMPSVVPDLRIWVPMGGSW